MDPVDVRAHRIGRRQRGLATRRQLLDAGISARTIARRLASGRWREPVAPVIDLGTHPDGCHRSVQRLLLAAGERAWASHETAAYLHGFLDVDRPDRIDVLVPRERHAEVGGVRLHTTVSLGADEMTRVDGLPCTTPARTLLDLAGATPTDELERFALDLARRRPKLMGEVGQLIDRRRGAHGRRRLLGVLANLPDDVARIESPLEVRGIQVFGQAGLPPPCLQYVVHDEAGAPIKRVDAAWPRARVVVEFDGAAYHDLIRQRDHDAAVRARIEAAGWQVIVVRAADLSGDRLAALLRRLRAAVT